MSMDSYGNPYRVVDVEGTDTLLVLTQDSRKGSTKIQSLSKRALTEYGPRQAMVDASTMYLLSLTTVFIMNATTTIPWLSSLLFLTPLIVLGFPIFMALAYFMNSLLVQKKDFSIGGELKNKEIFKDGTILPEFHMSENFFLKRNDEIIDECREFYRDYVNVDKTSTQTESHNSQVDEKIYEDYIKNNKEFSKVFGYVEENDSNDEIVKSNNQEQFSHNHQNENIDVISQLVSIREKEQDAVVEDISDDSEMLMVEDKTSNNTVSKNKQSE